MDTFIKSSSVKNEFNCNFRFKIILSRPRNPDNIGAAARAMANFGLNELAVAAPHLPAWRETLEIPPKLLGGRPVRLMERAAVGAADVLDSARICATVASAASDCVLLLGTSALQRRTPDRDVILLPDLRGYLADRLAGKNSRVEGRGERVEGDKVGILFGSEKTGLTNSELSHCHAVINIPACGKQPSVNLGQAVALVCYELAGRLPAGVPRAARAAAPVPSVRQIERVVSDICSLLEETEGWGGGRYAQEVRRGLLDARLTKGAMGILNLLLRRAQKTGDRV
ncbi:MAG: RNA methyltransferase [Elusimicrobia bacterium]|nr:RNA methyltransferase [Elusimicrobiota bacterium]